MAEHLSVARKKRAFSKSISDFSPERLFKDEHFVLFGARYSFWRRPPLCGVLSSERHSLLHLGNESEENAEEIIHDILHRILPVEAEALA